MQKKMVIIFLFLGIVIMLIGFVFLHEKNFLSHHGGIKIIDATYNCANSLEKFYEDDKYVYYFPCKKSNSIYVKFSNGNKMLVTEALSQDKVTISELISAGIDIRKQKK